MKWENSVGWQTGRDDPALNLELLCIKGREGQPRLEDAGRVELCVQGRVVKATTPPCFETESLLFSAVWARLSGP